MESLILATLEAQEANVAHLKSEFNAELSSLKIRLNADMSALKTQYDEKMFNNSLKYDMQQKHLKDNVKSELDTIKQDVAAQKKFTETDLKDVRSASKADLTTAQTNATVWFRSELDKEKANLRIELEQAENRLMKYIIGFFVSVGALLLTAVRLFSSPPPSFSGSFAPPSKASNSSDKQNEDIVLSK